MRGIGPWGLRMVMHDREYNALDRSREMAKRDMLVMKVVTVPVPIYEDSDHSLSFDGDEGEGVEGVGKGAETSDNTNKGSHGVPSSAQTPESSEMEEKRALKPKKTELHNVLGKLFEEKEEEKKMETEVTLIYPKLSWFPSLDLHRTFLS
ncbi:hypothetical protein BX616_002877 [Lobosporangium transversale]|nr:hypothetical protein BX616_002877 [Lobosporangium transversale]